MRNLCKFFRFLPLFVIGILLLTSCVSLSFLSGSQEKQESANSDELNDILSGFLSFKEKIPPTYTVIDSINSPVIGNIDFEYIGDLVMVTHSMEEGKVKYIFTVNEDGAITSCIENSSNVVFRENPQTAYTDAGEYFIEYDDLKLIFTYDNDNNLTAVKWYTSDYGEWKYCDGVDSLPDLEKEIEEVLSPAIQDRTVEDSRYCLFFGQIGIFMTFMSEILGDLMTSS